MPDLPPPPPTMALSISGIASPAPRPGKGLDCVDDVWLLCTGLMLDLTQSVHGVVAAVSLSTGT